MKEDLSRACNLCESKSFAVLATTDRDGNYLRTVICQDCGLVWSDPFPINPSEYYQKDYRILYKGVYQPKIKHIYRAAKVALDRYQKLKSYLNGRENLLEIGSGGGEFAYLLSKLGFAIQGIEPNEGYGNYSKIEYGLNVVIGFAQNTDFPAENFDMVVMNHVLEHVDNPSLVLGKIHGWLQTDGLLAIEVPNVEAVCQAPKNTFHTAHLFNFNPATLRLLAEKTGFSIVNSFLSKDGGNITLIAKKNAQAALQPKLSIPGNCEKISRIIQQHTPVSHYLSFTPYLRLMGKLFRMLDEKQAAKRFNTAKEVLDFCYKHLA